MERVALIAIAGAAGAPSRYAVQSWVNDLAGKPSLFGTLAVNVSGTFLIGLFLAATEDRLLSTPLWRTVAAVGFIGACTTFSTVMVESLDRLQTGDVLTAIANTAGSVMLGLMAVYLGQTLGRAL